MQPVLPPSLARPPHRPDRRSWRSRSVPPPRAPTDGPAHPAHARRGEHLLGDPLSGVGPRQRRRRPSHRLQPRAIAEQRAHLAGQPLRRQLGVGDDDRGARLGHPARVGALVVGRRVGIGHEDRRAPVGGDLEDRAAGARDAQVAGQQRLAERRDELAQVVVGRRIGAEPRAQRLVVARAAGVQHAEVGAGQRLHRRLVDRARAQRAAEDEHARVVRRQAEARAGGGAIGRRRRHRAPGDAGSARRRARRSGRPGTRAAPSARAGGWSGPGGCRPRPARAARAAPPPRARPGRRRSRRRRAPRRGARRAGSAAPRPPRPAACSAARAAFSGLLRLSPSTAIGRSS